MCNPVEIPSVEKVFAVAELTDIILGFAAFNRKLNEALELRQVCKSWKLALFPVLVSSKKMLSVDIGCPEKTRKFYKTVSYECDIPISIRISNSTWRLDQLRFLQTYASSIVTIEFVSMPVFEFEEIEKKFQTMDVSFSRLRSISVAPPSEQVNSSLGPVTNFVINRIQNCATRFPLDIMCGNEFIPSATTNRLPVKTDSFTFLCKTWNDDAGKLFMESPSRLSSLAIHANEVQNETKTNAMETVVQKFSKTLESLVLSLTGDGVEEIEWTTFKNLKSLEMRNIALKSDCKIMMPLLENLCIIGPAETVLDNLNALTNRSISHSNLNRLTLQAGTVSEQLPMFFVERFTWVMLQAIDSFPNLRVLNWRNVHMQVANVVLPVMFRTMRTLTKLSLDFVITSDLMSCDLTHLLTGVATRSVPKNGNDWIRLLIQSNRSISMLKCLEELEINNSYPSGEGLIVSPFIFAALSGIRSLTTLTLKGYITLDNAAATIWLNANPLRKINDFTTFNIHQ